MYKQGVEKLAGYIEYLPRDKFDFERLNQVKKLDRSELIPLLPYLLEWVQDMNWPIAKETSDILVTFPEELIPLLKDVLNGDDDIWKYWCLECVVKRFPENVKSKLRSELIRIKEKPTTGERLEELDTTAEEILDTMET